MAKASKDVCHSRKPIVATTLLTALGSLGCAAGGADLASTALVQRAESSPSDGAQQDDPPVYPWNDDHCDDVFEVRAHGANATRDNPYLVPPGEPVYPTFHFAPPWGRESVRAVAFQPLIDHPEDFVERVVLTDVERRIQLSSWTSNRDFAGAPSALAPELPTGSDGIALTVTYFNKLDEIVADSSGFAICVKYNQPSD